MDWLIWVIVIVLIVAIVWWLMSRNNRNSQSPTSGVSQGEGTPGQQGTTAPAAMEPSNTMSVPETAAAAAGVAGLAGVTNMGRAAAEGSGPAEEEARIHEEDAEREADAGREADLTHEESAPAVHEPDVAAPVVAEPVLSEPEIDTKAETATVQGGDVDDWEDGSSTPAAAGAPVADAGRRADDDADKAEWESSWTDAKGTPVHHHEYTDAHSPTLPGAETAAAEIADTGDAAGSARENATAEAAAAPSGHLAADHPYGVGSAGAAADGSGPDGYTVKADAATMTYFDEDSPGYAEAGADVWFESAAHAEAAGFRPPRRSRL